MIVQRHARDEVIARMRAKVARGHPLFVGACGTGLVARLLEKAGADFVCTFSGARLRNNGVGTMAMWWPILDSNQQLLDYTEADILPALAGQACVLACVNANDPLRDMATFLARLQASGVVAVSHAPSLGYHEKDSRIYQVLTQSGITLDHEIAMLKLAKQMELITFGQPFDLEDTQRIMEEAQPDALMFHAGTTKGGLTGFATPWTLEQTAARSEEAFRLAKRLKPDVFLFAHGAAMETPEDAQYILDHSSAHGIWTGSATERIPIERAVLDTATRFANLHRPEKREGGP